MKIKRNAYLGVLFAFMFFGCASLSHAGTACEIKCKDTKCGFKTQAAIGGGIVFEEAAGFCAPCKEWVSVTWKREEKAPLPFAEFWDPKTGETRRLYKCPKCGEPFVVIEKIENIKFCPSCKKPTLKSKQTMLYD